VGINDVCVARAFPLLEGKGFISLLVKVKKGGAKKNRLTTNKE
jgi:hypothetical protein